ncbi:hypothetical protein OG788_39105 [Streptomyces sp. NBC_00647]|uniref:hypothetical protein n=1 Tax=Streptomyces sp. NBC_00647 TaxID=2975796 RepID=UPI0032543066
MHKKRLAMGMCLLTVTAVSLLASGCSSEGAGSSGGKPRNPAVSRDRAVPLDFSRLKQAMPDLQSMPTGWKAGATRLQGRDTPRDAPCRRPKGGCQGKRSNAAVQYDNAESTGNVYIEASAFDDSGTARSGFEQRRASFAGPKDREVSMPKVGDESIARTGFHKYSGQPLVSMVMRVDTVVVAMVYTQEATASPETLLSLARMQAKRLQQAQRGEIPTADAR